MKTFEEFQFRVKHSNIASNTPKPFNELKTGDWFYVINSWAMIIRHCQILSVREEQDGTLWLKWSWEKGKNYDKNIPNRYKEKTFFNHPEDTFITTDPDIAIKYQKKFGIKEIAEYPIN